MVMINEQGHMISYIYHFSCGNKFRSKMFQMSPFYDNECIFPVNL